MEAKVDVLEADVASLKLTVETIQAQNALIMDKLDALNDQRRKRKTGDESDVDKEEEGSVYDEEGPKVISTKRTTTQRISSGGFKKLQGDSREEFSQSVKEIELSMFDEDPAGWISRAEVYFQVQETPDDVRVNLAQLCMEGPSIHFSNSLLEDEKELSWEQFKRDLDHYGGSR